MSNPVNADDKKIINVRIKRKQEPQQPAGPSALYSKEQVRQFVHEFVSSWIRGDIIIRFPTAAELAKKTPLNIAFPNDPSLTAELKIKEHYIDLPPSSRASSCFSSRSGYGNFRDFQDDANVS
jgi:hypothetical protein